MFRLFQSPATSPDFHDFSNMMESDLSTTTASSLRMLGCISLGPIGLYWFTFFRWSHTCSLLTVGGNFAPPLLPQPLPRGTGTWEWWEAWLAVNTEAKLLNNAAFSMSVVTSSSLFIRGGTLSLAFLFWPTYKISFFSLHLLLSSDPSVPWLSWSHLCTCRWHPLYSSQAMCPCFYC